METFQEVRDHIAAKIPDDCIDTYFGSAQRLARNGTKLEILDRIMYHTFFANYCSIYSLRNFLRFRFIISCVLVWELFIIVYFYFYFTYFITCYIIRFIIGKILIGFVHWTDVSTPGMPAETFGKLFTLLRIITLPMTYDLAILNLFFACFYHRIWMLFIIEF